MPLEKLIRVYQRLRKRFGNRHWWPGDTPLEVMVGAILTQNTAWTNVEKAIGNIKKAKALSVKKLLGMSDAQLAQMLKPSGYFNIKTQRLKNYLHFYQNAFGGRPSRMRSMPLDMLRGMLLQVKGIGPETADSILLYALNKPVFVVDAYTKRVFSRMGWVAQNLDYQGVQEMFMRNLPAKTALYNDYHAQIVHLGKEICRKLPRCSVCPVRDLCRSAEI